MHSKLAFNLSRDCWKVSKGQHVETPDTSNDSNKRELTKEINAREDNTEKKTYNGHQSVEWDLVKQNSKKDSRDETKNSTKTSGDGDKLRNNILKLN